MEQLQEFINLIEQRLRPSAEFLQPYDQDELVLNRILHLMLSDNKTYFVKSALDSYNTMLDNVKEIINYPITIKFDEEENPLTVLFKAKEIRFVHPKINDKIVTVPVALYYKLSYYVMIEVKYEQTVIKSEQTRQTRQTGWVEIVKLPIMVGSSICQSRRGEEVFDPLFSREDPGGYFILKGNKKAIFFKPRINFNEVLVLPNGKINVADKSKLSINDLSCQIISKNAYSYPSFSHYLLIEFEKGIFELVLKQPNRDQRFNFFTVIKNMSVKKDLDILNYLLCDVYLKHSKKEEVKSLLTVTLQESGGDISEDEIDTIRYSIAHLSTDDQKVDFLLFSLRRMIRVAMGYEDIDDRDNYYVTKCMDGPGSFTEELFINYFKIEKKVFKEKIRNTPPAKLNDMDILSEKKMFQTEYMLKFFVNSSQWGPSNKSGICELIMPVNYIHQYECLRKIVEDEKDRHVIIEKRRSRTDYQGLICSVTTPTSSNVGLHKYLALLAFINSYNYRQHLPLRKAVEEFISKFESGESDGYYYIFVDGVTMSSAASVQLVHALERFVDSLKFTRRQEFSPYIVHYVDYKKLVMNINTRGGRILVPVIRLKNNTLPVTLADVMKIKTFEELLDTHPGLVDYIDTYWMHHNSIAFSMKEIRDYNEEVKINYHPKARYMYKVVHLTPYAQYSMSLALCAFVSNQAAVRNGLGAKQLLSSVTCNPGMEYLSLEKTKKHLVHANLPLTRSPIDRYLGVTEIPINITMFTEICADIKNQEDSYILNWNAVARGALLMYEFKTFDMFISYKSNESFNNPMADQKVGGHNFSKLGPDGFVKMNEVVKYGDVLICKTETKKDENQYIKPKVETYDQYNVGRVCKVDPYNNDTEAKRFVYVKVCKTSLGEAADKLCLLPTVDVLTTTGWKQIKDVTLEDRVAVLDIENDNVKYEHPLKVHEYDYEGEMYQLRSRHVDLTVTPNHRMWVKKRCSKKFEPMIATEVYKHARIRYKKQISNFSPENWIGETFTIPSYQNKRGDQARPEIVVQMSDFLVFFGIFIAEGCVDKGGVSIAICKQRVKDALCPAVTNMGFKYCITKDNISLNIHNVQLAALIKTFSVGSINKFLPDWCWSLNKEQSIILLDSLMLGDGNTYRNSWVYSTSSERLKSDVEKLAFHCGYSTYSRVKPSNKKGTEKMMKKTGCVVRANADNWTITVLRAHLEPIMNHDYDKMNDEQWVPYKGKVNCLTVSSGVFLVKENGKPVLSSNSTDYGQKGVCGMVASASEFGQNDLNFIPSVKCSPCQHTRMTGGQLIIPLTNYYAIYSGAIVENNSFNPININSMRDFLESVGFQRDFLAKSYREETQQISINATTVVPLTYRRMKQLADEGNVKKPGSGSDPITRNPIKGKLGGSKIGRMEKDAFEIHATPEFIQGIINYNDKFFICNTCNIKVDNKDGRCEKCGSDKNITRTKVPAAFAAVCDFVQPAGININPHVKESTIVL